MPVSLNVGGTIYMTTQGTLSDRDPRSMLARLVSGPVPSTLDSAGNIFIDRDGYLFRHVLNYLRDGVERIQPHLRDVSKIPTPLAHDLLAEAKFYQLGELQSYIWGVITNEIDLHADAHSIKQAMVSADESIYLNTKAANGIERLHKYLLDSIKDKATETGSRADITVSIDDFGFSPVLYSAAFDKDVRVAVMDQLKARGLPLECTCSMDGPRRVFSFTLSREHLLHLKGWLPQ
eukprot:TRINITY_DN10141_c0_g1_i2.p1 TRINITY_DN10141_c0_g1~~TRINITY_DN10141_c0_g1_i2.p1  ORF type:complete len:234 (+),score=32.43 TRINITY_DN10141_c0_g1_i2:49-750(+)